MKNQLRKKKLKYLNTLSTLSIVLSAALLTSCGIKQTPGACGQSVSLADTSIVSKKNEYYMGGYVLFEEYLEQTEKHKYGEFGNTRKRACSALFYHAKDKLNGIGYITSMECNYKLNEAAKNISFLIHTNYADKTNEYISFKVTDPQNEMAHKVYALLDPFEERLKSFFFNELVQTDFVFLLRSDETIKTDIKDRLCLNDGNLRKDQRVPSPANCVWSFDSAVREGVVQGKMSVKQKAVFENLKNNAAKLEARMLAEPKASIFKTMNTHIFETQKFAETMRSMARMYVVANLVSERYCKSEIESEKQRCFSGLIENKHPLSAQLRKVFTQALHDVPSDLKKQMEISLEQKNLKDFIIAMRPAVYGIRSGDPAFPNLKTVRALQEELVQRSLELGDFIKAYAQPRYHKNMSFGSNIFTEKKTPKNYVIENFLDMQKEASPLFGLEFSIDDKYRLVYNRTKTSKALQNWEQSGSFVFFNGIPFSAITPEELQTAGVSMQPVPSRVAAAEVVNVPTRNEQREKTISQPATANKETPATPKEVVAQLPSNSQPSSSAGANNNAGTNSGTQKEAIENRPTQDNQMGAKAEKTTAQIPDSDDTVEVNNYKARVCD